MQFICPHCESILNVPDRYLGQRGKCNKCGERIALIGTPGLSAPQPASKIAEVPAGPPAKPATEKQLDYLRALGADAASLQGLDREAASEQIDQRKAQRRAAEPPTRKQLDYLAQLGATPGQISRIDSKEAASQLIEAMHLHPAPEQLATLRALGASGAQIAALKSRGAAEALLERLQN